jgi:hypothetical protein
MSSRVNVLVVWTKKLGLFFITQKAQKIDDNFFKKYTHTSKRVQGLMTMAKHGLDD